MWTPNKNANPKFKRGSRVKIAKDLGSSMSHFENDCEAIVQYTYAQKYGGDNIDSYSLVLLNDKGVAYNAVSWYYERQLTLLDDDLQKGLAIMETYFYG